MRYFFDIILLIKLVMWSIIIDLNLYHSHYLCRLSTACLFHSAPELHVDSCRKLKSSFLFGSSRIIHRIGMINFPWKEKYS